LHVRTKGLILGHVQGVGSAFDRDSAKRTAGGASTSAVTGNLMPVVAAVVSGVVHAAGIFLDGRSVLRQRDTVAVVVDASGTSGSDVTASAIAGTSVDDGRVGGVVVQGGVGRAEATVGLNDARLLREVIAVDDATRHLVVKGALGQPSA